MSTVVRPDQTHYELEQKLGEGLNSNVWLATRYDHARENPRKVALKLPKDQTAVPFLRREHDTLQRINSMHVARVIAFETINAQAALAIEYIDGVTLKELSQHGLTPKQRDEIMRQLHQALEDVDRAQTHHGDINPENIMIDREGLVRLIDFASGKTNEGLLQATPAFISPELWAGQSSSIESDHFALKVIREHMLDGFTHLPARSSSAKAFKPAKENAVARSEIAQKVANLKTTGTQLVEVDTDDGNGGAIRGRNGARAENRASGHPGPQAKPMRAKLVAWVASVLFVLNIPVFAEDPPPELPATARISVTSTHWMQITLNGKEAGYTPLRLAKLKAGKQHIAWKTATQHGDLTLTMQPTSDVQLTEREGRLEVR